MNTTLHAVEECLERTHRCADQIAGDRALAAQLRSLQAWQAQRLARTYADLRLDKHCRAAVDFFLSDLYGAHDFSARDLSFARAWHLLRRGLPQIMLEVLASVAELQALTAELDLALARQLPAGELTTQRYLTAYRAAAQAAERIRQIDLIEAIGGELVRAIESPWIGWALRAAHAPARLAGFTALQSFLERGYEAFRMLDKPSVFLSTIHERERRLSQALFAGNDAEAIELLWPRDQRQRSGAPA